MGKQRTPQGRPTGRGTPPRSATGNAGKPAEAVQAPVPAAAPEAALHPAENAFPAGLPESAPEPLHAHLMDTVSPEALGAAAPEPKSEPAPEMPVPADANLAGADPVESVSSESASSESAPPPAEPEPEVPAPEAPAPEVLAAESAPVPEPELEPVVEIAPDPAPPAAYTNVVPLKSVETARPPEPAGAAEAPVQLSDGVLPSPASWRAGRRSVPPLRQDFEGMGETLFAFVRNESAAAITHFNALKDARSPADAIRLQVNEIQRAADASLTCWSEIARRVTRIVAQR